MGGEGCMRRMGMRGAVQGWCVRLVFGALWCSTVSMPIVSLGASLADRSDKLGGVV